MSAADIATGAEAAVRRRRLIAAVHARAKEIGLDEATRRALQERVGGAASCRDMDLAGLGAVLEAMRGGDPGVAGRIDPPRDDLDAMRRRALALAAELGGDRRYVDAIAERQWRKPLAVCTREEVKGVIGALWSRKRKLGAAS